jgi:hypothetical protein
MHIEGTSKQLEQGRPNEEAVHKKQIFDPVRNSSDTNLHSESPFSNEGQRGEATHTEFVPRNASWYENLPRSAAANDLSSSSTNHVDASELEQSRHEDHSARQDQLLASGSTALHDLISPLDDLSQSESQVEQSDLHQREVRSQQDWQDRGEHCLPLGDCLQQWADRLPSRKKLLIERPVREMQKTLQDLWILVKSLVIIASGPRRGAAQAAVSSAGRSAVGRILRIPDSREFSAQTPIWPPIP